MTLQEKALYHQIHPLKLGTDVISAIISVYFLWIHNLPVALLVMFIPAFVASGVLINVANFDWIRDSAVGRYLSWSMTRALEEMLANSAYRQSAGRLRNEIATSTNAHFE
jgi:hypothetical protein